MKSSSLIVFLVIFAFGFLMPWTVEGAPKRELDFLRPYPEKGKPGACPFVRPVLCFVYEPPECQSDWQCPKRQKCCQGLCGIKCTDPVDTSKSDSSFPGQKN
ncbi:PREDICTED: antileukoproteinase [Capra hircus]|uniref:WAP domain-containing protein n=1 Tax=Capra hircus TaxID=9925 RepID=A0A452F9H0_CAPHI|nr:PREDICTED: antileukoproteinase [Capra hircus]